jgi:hypothetical protein
MWAAASKKESFMLFDPPITFRRKDGSQRTAGDLRLVLLDNSQGREVLALLPPSDVALSLWSGEAYDAIGDYTQAQAEARVLEVLGDNPAEVLSAPLPPHLQNPVLPEPSSNPY